VKFLSQYSTHLLGENLGFYLGKILLLIYSCFNFVLMRDIKLFRQQKKIQSYWSPERLEQYLEKDKHSIFIRFSSKCPIKGKTVTFEKPTGLKVRFSEFDAPTQSIKGNKDGLSKIRLTLAKIQEAFQELTAEYNEQNTPRDASFIEKVLQEAIDNRISDKEKKIVHFSTWLNDHFIPNMDSIRVRKNKKQVQIGFDANTQSNYKQMQTKFNEYEKQNNTKLSLLKAEKTDIMAFENWLRNDYDPIYGLAESTIGKHIDCFLSCASYAESERDINISNAISRYERPRIPEKKREDILVLTPEEVKKVITVQGLSEKLENIRKLFIMQYYTAIRVSSLKKFKFTHFEEEVDDQGNTYWDVTVQDVKNDKEIILAVVEKEFINIVKANDYRIISEQKLNDYYKELCKIAGITSTVKSKKTEIVGHKKDGDKKLPITRGIISEKPKYHFISSHVLRRTRCTALYESGMPPEEIISITDHSSIQMLYKYIRVNPDKKARSRKTVSYIRNLDLSDS